MDEFFRIKSEELASEELKKRIAIMLNGAITNLQALNETFDNPEGDNHITIIADYIDAYLGGIAPIAFLEKLLSYYKQRKQYIVSNAIPSLMHELGIVSTELENGTKITLHTDVSISCPKEHKPMLYAWLEKEGHGDEIKTNVAFNKGDYTKDVEAQLETAGMPFTVTQDIHSQTLKRIFRERMEEGKPEPDSTIATVTTFEYAKVKK